MKLTAIKETVMNHGVARFAQLRNIALVSFLLLSSGLQVSPAYARLATDDPPQEALDCLGDLQGTLSSTSQTVDLWQTATLRWNVTVPRICTGIGVKLYVDNRVVSPAGSQSVLPIGTTGYRLHAALPAVFGGARRTLATTSIKVKLPLLVTISANHWVPLLVQALRFEENKNADGSIIDPAARRYINIENHVELDLSGRESIPIEGGVTLMGKRTSLQPGPRLYTTTYPQVLFIIDGDNVRIAGVRIQGPDMGVSAVDDNCCSGIRIDSNVNIDIQNNEIFGWRNSAVVIRDNSDRISYVFNPETVRVRDNYIHHNQHVGRLGYGVSVKDGAYALIERNVFDYNRHAIEGDGSDGSGYRAFRNLVLENGGYHDTYNACDLDPDWLKFVSPSTWALAKTLCLLTGAFVKYDHYTHQFDMHGQGSCGIGGVFDDSIYNCGTAGHDMEIRYNSFFYTKGNAIKLRGTPQLAPNGAFVISNVFAHGNLLDDSLLGGGAVAQTETGLFTSDNLVGVNGMNDLGACDFDGDGLNDHFLATGQTWWYSSGGDKPWVYLNTSLKRRAEVTLGFFNADNICDVWVDGIVYPGGRSPTVKPPLPPGGGVLQ